MSELSPQSAPMRTLITLLSPKGQARAQRSRRDEPEPGVISAFHRETPTRENTRQIGTSRAFVDFASLTALPGMTSHHLLACAAAPRMTIEISD
jgi:hypothetical protein